MNSSYSPLFLRWFFYIDILISFKHGLYTIYRIKDSPDFDKILSSISKTISSSFTRFEKATKKWFFLCLWFLLNRRWLFKTTFGFCLRLFQVVKNGTLGNTKHVPYTFQVGFIFFLHTLQSFVKTNNSFLNSLNFKFNKGRNAFIKWSIVDLFRKCHFLSLFVH